MAKFPSFPFYAQDFDMDTNTWTNEEVGVYLRLLLAHWINGPLPDDHQKLAKIARISRKKFTNLFQNIKHKWHQNGNGFLINLKMEKVRQEMLKYRELKVKAGLKGAQKRWDLNSITNGCAIAKPMANGMAKNSSSSSSSSSSLNTINDTIVSLSRKAVTREDCPQQKIIELYHSKLPELPPINSWPEHLQKILKTRWRESKERQSLDWWEKYFKFVRTSPFLMGKVTDFMADLEWIIRPKNMAKILNGRYHKDHPLSGKFGAKTIKTIENLEEWLNEKSQEVG